MRVIPDSDGGTATMNAVQKRQQTRSGCSEAEAAGNSLLNCKKFPVCREFRNRPPQGGERRSKRKKGRAKLPANLAANAANGPYRGYLVSVPDVIRLAA
jgi:hypothetical protein